MNCSRPFRLGSRMSKLGDDSNERRDRPTGLWRPDDHLPFIPKAVPTDAKSSAGAGSFLSSWSIMMTEDAKFALGF
jgi:hypothetical protein